MRVIHRLRVLPILTLAVMSVWPAANTLAQTRTAAAPTGGRESWQRIPDIFDAMGIAPGAVVADIGAGDGFFTTRLAKAVGPSGRVYAVDISAPALDRLRTSLSAEGLSNVEVILGAAHDPKLPTGVLDAALVINAYHEMSEHQAMLLAIRRALKPNGRLVIVESAIDAQRGAPRDSQTSHHYLAPHYVQQDVVAAGFLITRVEDPFTQRGGPGREYLMGLTPTPAPVAGQPANTPAAMEAWKKPDDVVAALQLRPGHVVVDLGAGPGMFTRRFARAVGPSGRAIGLDVDSAAIAAMKQDAAALGLTNYEARLVAPDDPAIPAASADVIFLSNTYHHIADRVAYFSRIRSALKANGRLVIVEFTPEAGGTGMPGYADQKTTEAELTAAGYRLMKTHTFLERQFFLEFIVAR